MNNLRTYRKKVHMDATYLANKAEISVRHLQFIESGKRSPSLQVAKKIADSLNGTVDEIFFGENESCRE